MTDQKTEAAFNELLQEAMNALEPFARARDVLGERSSDFSLEELTAAATAFAKWDNKFTFGETGPIGPRKGTT